MNVEEACVVLVAILIGVVAIIDIIIEIIKKKKRKSILEEVKKAKGYMSIMETGSIRLTGKTIKKCIDAGCKTVGDMETMLKARRAIRNKK